MLYYLGEKILLLGKLMSWKKVIQDIHLFQ